MIAMNERAEELPSRSVYWTMNCTIIGKCCAKARKINWALLMNNDCKIRPIEQSRANILWQHPISKSNIAAPIELKSVSERTAMDLERPVGPSQHEFAPTINTIQCSWTWRVCRQLRVWADLNRPVQIQVDRSRPGRSNHEHLFNKI